MTLSIYSYFEILNLTDTVQYQLSNAKLTSLAYSQLASVWTDLEIIPRNSLSAYRMKLVLCYLWKVC